MADARSQRLVLPTPEAGYSYDNEAAFRREVESAINSVDQTILGLDTGGDSLPTYAVLLTAGSYSGTVLASTGFVTIPQTGQYAFEAVLRYYATTTDDWRVRPRYTSSCVGYFVDDGASVSGTGAATTNEGGSRNMVGASAARMVRLYGFMDITAAGGEFHLDISEITSSNILALYAGSYMKLTRIGDT